MTNKILKGLNLLTIFVVLTSCHNHDTKIEIANPLKVSRNEIVEVPLAKLPSNPKGGWSVIDAQGQEVQSQITNDSLLIFIANVDADTTAIYSLRPTKNPAVFDTISTGRIYHERMDDLAWENDNVAFRAYGPAMQKRGERGFGYDLFLKHGPTTPVLEELYAIELTPGWHHKVDSLRKAGLNEQADSVYNYHSYHRDSGLGMDCYAVGPTLGGGVAALLRNDNTFAYPWCYSQAEILDQGPLRFKAKLTFAPVAIDEDTIVEERVITLDAGENLNHTLVHYNGLKSPRTIVSGVPLRDDGAFTTNQYQGYLSYRDPASQENSPLEKRGNLFVGLSYPFTPDSIKKTEDAGQPHLVSYTTYQPNTDYEYYWGYGWDKGNVPDQQVWDDILSFRALRARYPLTVTVIP